MIVNPFLEFEPVLGEENYFYIHDYMNKKRLKINLKTLIKIIELSSVKIEKEEVNSTFLENNIVIDEKNDYIQYLLNEKKKWEKYNWKESFKYHLSTLNYKFEGDLEKSNDVMIEYSNTESDSLRTKNYNYEVSYKLPKFEDCIGMDFCFDESKKLTKDKLFMLLTYNFGFVKSGVPKWKGENIYLRTVPSGGARQATEGYVYIQDVDDLDSGWYYINGDKLQIEKINENILNSQEFSENYSVVFANSSIESRAVIVLTSVFEKNMYRYREPRTFRSIHMDIGHILGQLELMALQFNVSSEIQYGVEDNWIEDKLGIDYLMEGYQGTIILGDGE